MNYDTYFQEVGKQYGVDPLMLKTIGIKESGLNPNVRDNKNPNGSYDVGLMQINTRDPEYQKYGYHALKTDPLTSIKAAAETLQDKAKQLKAGGYEVNSFNLFRAYNGDGPQAYAYAHDAITKYTGLGGSGSVNSLATVPGGVGPPAPGEKAPGWESPSSSGGGDLSFSQSIARFSLLGVLGLVGVFAVFQLIGGGKVVAVAAKVAGKGVV